MAIAPAIDRHVSWDDTISTFHLSFGSSQKIKMRPLFVSHQSECRSERSQFSKNCLSLPRLPAPNRRRCANESAAASHDERD
jgi:hypothetical protein